MKRYFESFYKPDPMDELGETAAPSGDVPPRLRR
jgi:hypothetical protein